MTSSFRGAERRSKQTLFCTCVQGIKQLSEKLAARRDGIAIILQLLDLKIAQVVAAAGDGYENEI